MDAPRTISTPKSRITRRAVDWLLGLRHAPLVLLFLVVAWTIFLRMVRANGWISPTARPKIGFVATLWTADPWYAFVQSHVGIVIQHSWGQIIYVSLLLVVFGIAYERRVGSLRTLVVFYGACLIGIATLLAVLSWAFLAGPTSFAWRIAHTSWSGASVGCFGLVGAWIATTRHPGWYASLWSLYVVVVEWTLVPSVAVLMHATGFGFGFLLTRLALWQPTSMTAVSPLSAEDARPRG